MKKNDTETVSLLPGFTIAPMSDLTLFLISEAELDDFSRGSSESPLLTFGVGLFSAGLSFGTMLLTVNDLGVSLRVFFWVATLVGLINGAVLVLVWRSKRKSMVSLADRIRARKPPSGEPEQIVEGADAAIEARPLET